MNDFDHLIGWYEFKLLRSLSLNDKCTVKLSYNEQFGTSHCYSLNRGAVRWNRFNLWQIWLKKLFLITKFVIHEFHFILLSFLNMNSNMILYDNNHWLQSKVCYLLFICLNSYIISHEINQWFQSIMTTIIIYLLKLYIWIYLAEFSSLSLGQVQA